jgi:hypothetical protein
MMSRKATFGAIRAAWKSIECIIGDVLRIVTFTSWPSRTWMTGPGAVLPNVHVWYRTPGAICSTWWLIDMFTVATGPGWRAGSSAG